MTKSESRALIDKHHLDFTEVQYGNFRLSVGDIEEVLTRYEAIGAEESAIVVKLREHLKVLDEKLLLIPHFQSSENYPNNLNVQLSMAALQGDIETLQSIISQYELRQLPYSESQNEVFSVPDLRQMTGSY